jgi:hypothetical protein
VQEEVLDADAADAGKRHPSCERGEHLVAGRRVGSDPAAALTNWDRCRRL